MFDIDLQSVLCDQILLGLFVLSENLREDTYTTSIRFDYDERQLVEFQIAQITYSCGLEMRVSN